MKLSVRLAREMEDAWKGFGERFSIIETRRRLMLTLANQLECDVGIESMQRYTNKGGGGLDQIVT